MITRVGRRIGAVVVFAAMCTPAAAQMRITEFMYDGVDGEFVEFTNVGSTPIDMTGWSFDDDSHTAGSFSLTAFGTVAAGESVILTEPSAATFRTNWNLCAGVKVIGGNNQNLGRNDALNLYDAGSVLADTLSFGDQNFPGTPRTSGKSAWVSAAGLGQNQMGQWTASTLGDAETSYAGVGGNIASPGHSTRASVIFNPCAPPLAPKVGIDTASTTPLLDLEATTQGAVSAVIGDSTDPAATLGFDVTLAPVAGDDVANLVFSASSNNIAVVPNDAGHLVVEGSGATRHVRIVPLEAGYASITLTATDLSSRHGSYVVDFAASAAAPADAIFPTGASDISSGIALDADTMLTANDEDQALRIYHRHQSGLALAQFDFSAQLGLTELSGGVPREVDLEAVAQHGDRLYWTGSFSNSKDGAARPNRNRVFATTLSGTGATATLTYIGRYDHLRDDLIAWDQANGHGLGADALGFAASAAVGVVPEGTDGFNVEGLAIAPNGTTAYVAFRAPLEPMASRDHALIVPVLNFDALITGAAPGSSAAGSAQFGAPIELDLGGRGLREIVSNAPGQYLLVAGPPRSSGAIGTDFVLYAWSGDVADAPVLVGADLSVGIGSGSVESLLLAPYAAGPGSILQTLIDDGDTVWYGDNQVSKDLGEPRFQKFHTRCLAIELPAMPKGDALFQATFEGCGG